MPRSTSASDQHRHRLFPSLPPAPALPGWTRRSVAKCRRRPPKATANSSVGAPPPPSPASQPVSHSPLVNGHRRAAGSETGADTRRHGHQLNEGSSWGSKGGHRRDAQSYNDGTTLTPSAGRRGEAEGGGRGRQKGAERAARAGSHTAPVLSARRPRRTRNLPTGKAQNGGRQELTAEDNIKCS